MKIIQRNKQKFKVFEDDELKYRLGMNDINIAIVKEYQDKFPELMIDNGEGFCIDARKLHSQLVKDAKVNKKGKSIVGDIFSQWMKRRLNKYKFVKNEDYISVHENVNAKFTEKEIEEMSSQKQSSYGITTEYKLTLDTAKQLCMIENNDNGMLCRKYFMTMEKTLKEYKEWNEVREPEREEAKIMKKSIQDWCNRNGYDSTLEVFYTREFNGLNENLTGYVASELRTMFECRDNITRNNLNKDINNGLLELQKLNIQLLDADMDFENRMMFIKNTCKNKYKDLCIKK